MGYKTTDGLMRHLRDNGIAISGSAQKKAADQHWILSWL